METKKHFLLLLEQLEKRHSSREISKYCHRLSKGVRPTRRADLWNVTFLCAWEHIFGEYQDVLEIVKLADDYRFKDGSTWGPMRWTYGLCADVWRRLGDLEKASFFVNTIMEHENVFYARDGTPLLRGYYEENAEYARRDGRHAAMIGWQLHQYCELIFCSLLPHCPIPAQALLDQAGKLAATLRSEIKG